MGTRVWSLKTSPVGIFFAPFPNSVRENGQKKSPTQLGVKVGRRSIVKPGRGFEPLLSHFVRKCVTREPWLGGPSSEAIPIEPVGGFVALLTRGLPRSSTIVGDRRLHIKRQGRKIRHFSDRLAGYDHATEDAESPVLAPFLPSANILQLPQLFFPAQSTKFPPRTESGLQLPVGSHSPYRVGHRPFGVAETRRVEVNLGPRNWPGSPRLTATRTRPR